MNPIPYLRAIDAELTSGTNSPGPAFTVAAGTGQDAAYAVGRSGSWIAKSRTPYPMFTSG